MKNVCIFALDFERDSATKNRMPHSSSGPGHLPLTQKIISSTLICGTKSDKSTWFVAFLFLPFVSDGGSRHGAGKKKIEKSLDNSMNLCTFAVSK